MDEKVILGGKYYSKFATTHWTGNLMGLMVCPKCDKFLGYFHTNHQANWINYAKFYFKYYRGSLSLPKLNKYPHECIK